MKKFNKGIIHKKINTKQVPGFDLIKGKVLLELSDKGIKAERRSLRRPSKQIAS